MPCPGNASDHCCYLPNKCGYVRDDGRQADPGARRWVCTLRESLGSWAAVHADARYQADVKPKLSVIPVMVEHGMTDCGDWPGPLVCGTCGETGA